MGVFCVFHLGSKHGPYPGNTDHTGALDGLHGAC